MLNDYIKNSPRIKKVEWWELPNWINVELNKEPSEVKKRGDLYTIGRLKKFIKDKKKITNTLSKLKKGIFSDKKFKIKFPIKLDNLDYVRLYALMTSEGSYRTEFSLNVPEMELHQIFELSIRKLISQDTSNMIKYDYNKEFLRSRAPAVLRKIIPFPDHIPLFILREKEFAREYLKTAFECEGSPILDKKQHKRYIKLSRYVDISDFVLKEQIPLRKRIYRTRLKKKYGILFRKIKHNPPKILVGENILLKKHFDIDSTLVLEAIRKNKVDNRAGKFTARWVLFIYANNIDKFIKDIRFITERKNKILEEMKTIKGYNPQYFALKVMEGVSKKKVFRARDFNKAMSRMGYKTPQKFTWYYSKKGLITKVSRGLYKIQTNSTL